MNPNGEKKSEDEKDDRTLEGKEGQKSLKDLGNTLGQTPEKIKDLFQDIGQEREVKKIVDEFFEIFQPTEDGIRKGFKKLGEEYSPDLQKKVILELITKKQEYWVARNLGKLKGLDRDVAIKLLDSDLGEYVLRNYAKFQGIGINEIATMLLEKNQWYVITNNLKSLKGLSLKVALALIKVAEKHELSSIAYYLEAFEELNLEIAQKLIESGEGDFKLDLFPKEEQKKILAILAKHGLGELQE